MPQNATLVWFQRDLRLADHPALISAVERGSPLIPVYIWSTEDEGDWPPGAAARWWLHHSLARLDKELRKLGSRLIVREGRPASVFQDLIVETGADAIFWNRRYEPSLVARGADIKSEFRSQNIEVESFNGSLLYEPWEILTQQEKPFRVFGAFWKACVARPEPPYPLPTPRQIPHPSKWPKSLPLDDLPLLPVVDWTSGFRAEWSPGSEGAEALLDRFIEEALQNYTHDRDRPYCQGTSRLSPYLTFGNISPRQVMHAVLAYAHPGNQQGAKSVWAFIRQLAWREFSYHLLFHFPFTSDQPLNAAFAHFPWREDPGHLKAWQRGQTGFPLIDAGMRELWRTGWMHNRVRMAVASFLVKDLLIPWQEGARWFWDTLLDADLANNTMGWQWTAGCGADAAPYFRIFNPVLQGERFDPEGVYVRRWIPELASLPSRFIHKPWEAPPSLLKDCGIDLGVHYPEPIVDHAEARQLALELYDEMKSQKVE